jgi:hypothetical protein
MGMESLTALGDFMAFFRLFRRGSILRPVHATKMNAARKLPPQEIRIGCGWGNYFFNPSNFSNTALKAINTLTNPASGTYGTLGKTRSKALT